MTINTSRENAIQDILNTLCDPDIMEADRSAGLNGDDMQMVVDSLEQAIYFLRKAERNDNPIFR